MKDFILLTAVCIAVVVGVGWFLLPGSPTDLFRPKVTVQAETPDPADKPAAVVDRPHEKSPKVSALHAGSDGAPSARLVSAVDAISQAAAAPAAAPTAALAAASLPWDVLPGEQASDVVNAYGAPSLYTSTQDSGHLFETYVYRSSGTQAIVHLEDGRVSHVSMKGSLGR